MLSAAFGELKDGMYQGYGVIPSIVSAQSQLYNISKEFVLDIYGVCREGISTFSSFVCGRASVSHTPSSPTAHTGGINKGHCDNDTPVYIFEITAYAIYSKPHKGLFLPTLNYYSIPSDLYNCLVLKSISH